MVDLRFSTALQLMLSLALGVREGVTTMSSSELAEGVATNPSLVRRLVAPLVQAGLLGSTRGTLGGVALARAASEITLADVYRAVHPERRLFSQRTDIPHRCLVSSNIEGLFTDLESDVDEALIAVLERRTLHSCLDEMRAAPSRVPRLRKVAARRGR